MRCGCCVEPHSSTLVVDPLVQRRADGLVAVDLGTSSIGSFEASAALELMGKRKVASDDGRVSQSMPLATERHPSYEHHPSKDGLALEKLAFEATLVLVRGEPLGINIDLSEGHHLRISKVEEEGQVVKYNAGVKEDERIRDGDFIVAVNSMRANSKGMMQALHNIGSVDLSLRRPHEFTVAKLDKEGGGGSLGLDLTYQAKSVSVVIKDVLPSGAVQVWNSSCSPIEEIKPNDHILCVNGFRGTARQLVQAMNESSVLELLLSRPAVP